MQAKLPFDEFGSHHGPETGLQRLETLATWQAAVRAGRLAKSAQAMCIVLSQDEEHGDAFRPQHCKFSPAGTRPSAGGCCAHTRLLTAARHAGDCIALAFDAPELPEGVQFAHPGEPGERGDRWEVDYYMDDMPTALGCTG